MILFILLLILFGFLVHQTQGVFIRDDGIREHWNELGVAFAILTVVMGAVATCVGVAACRCHT